MKIAEDNANVISSTPIDPNRARAFDEAYGGQRTWWP